MVAPKTYDTVARSWLRAVFLAASVFLIFVQVLLLSPSALETGEDSNATLDTQDLMTLFYDRDESHAPGIPKGQVPDYMIDRFKTISSLRERKEWKLHAERAYMYNANSLVHTTQIYVELYDEQGETTIVTGDEGVTFMDKRDLEIFGNVQATFPDGFVMKSEYLLYQPQEGRFEIPAKYWVTGTGKNEDGGQYEFKSQGLTFTRFDNKIKLKESVTFVTTGKKEEDTTTIRSDSCDIDRTRKVARFYMAPSRKGESAYVRIDQPNLEVRSRLADLNFGGSAKSVHLLTAREDVKIKEIGTDKKIRYGTCGKADFYRDQNKIVLTEFPQVYQDQDTVTGEVIVMYRDSDTVEVEQSNAYSTGKEF